MRGTALNDATSFPASQWQYHLKLIFRDGVIATLVGTTNAAPYFWRHSGSSAAVSAANPAGVWNANYAGVWHFAETNHTLADSTAGAHPAANPNLYKGGWNHWTFTYNDALQLAAEAVPVAAGAPPAALTRTYNPLGSPTGLTLGSDYAVTYGYSADGRCACFAAAVVLARGRYDGCGRLGVIFGNCFPSAVIGGL
jgi:hypothetical protein